jgi:hypothetical protein
MTTIQCTLAGANFRPGEARTVCKSLQIGETAMLETDGDNPYDSNAVRVIAQDEFIGFVPKSDNAPIFAALERGEEVTVEIIGFESSIKPILEITLSDELNFE